MNTQERQIIDGLFDRLRQVERQSAPREPLAEAHIRSRIEAQPGAPYYMAQVVVVQEQALQAAQARIEELERALASRPSGGGFLSTLFGGQPQSAPPPPPRPGAFTGGRGAAMPAAPPAAGPWGGGPGMAGAAQAGRGGFLAGAAQTAMGVVGGMLLGNMLMSAFGSGEAKAAETGGAQAEPHPADHQTAALHDTDDHDMDDDFGGDFGDDI